MRTVYLLVVALALPALALGQKAKDRTSENAFDLLVQDPYSNSFTWTSDDSNDPLTWTVLGGQNGTKVDLDVRNATVSDALKELFSKSKSEYKLEDKDLPDTRISLSAKQVRFSTALDLIMQSSGLHYSVQVQNGKTTYRIGKKVAGSPNVFWNGNTFNNGTALFSTDATKGLNVYRNSLKFDPKTWSSGLKNNNFRSLTLDPNSAYVYTLGAGENRSTFVCPHCKGQVTVIRHTQQLKCPKCSRNFQSEWQFCPFDGAKRPVVTGGWKYCPICGKEVNMEKEEKRSSEGRVPVLGDLPIVGQLFKVDPSTKP